MSAREEPTCPDDDGPRPSGPLHRLVESRHLVRLVRDLAMLLPALGGSVPHAPRVRRGRTPTPSRGQATEDERQADLFPESLDPVRRGETAPSPDAAAHGGSEPASRMAGADQPRGQVVRLAERQRPPGNNGGERPAGGG